MKYCVGLLKMNDWCESFFILCQTFTSTVENQTRLDILRAELAYSFSFKVISDLIRL